MGGTVNASSLTVSGGTYGRSGCGVRLTLAGGVSVTSGQLEPGGQDGHGGDELLGDSDGGYHLQLGGDVDEQ